MSKRCSKCNTSNPDNAHYCASCGNTLTTGDMYVVVPKKLFEQQNNHAVQPVSQQYNIVLQSTGSRLLEVVKTVKEVGHKGLKEAKDLVDCCRYYNLSINVCTTQTLEQAQGIKAQLEQVGAKSVITTPVAGSSTYTNDTVLYSVYLKNTGVSALAVVKAVKECSGKGLKESKDIVDACKATGKSQLICTVSSRQKALLIKQEMESCGATVNITP